MQRIILDSAGEKPLKERLGATLKPVDFKAVKRELKGKISREPSEQDIMSYLMYPPVFLELQKHLAAYSRTSVIPTPAFFFGLKMNEEINIEIEPGKTLVVKFITVSPPQPDGTRTVYFELNGSPRDVTINDTSLTETIVRNKKADPDNAHHIGAPMPGKVGNVAIKKGQAVKANERLLSIEAMKMETAVYAPRDGTVGEVAVSIGSTIAAGDLLLVLE